MDWIRRMACIGAVCLTGCTDGTEAGSSEGAPSGTTSTTSPAGTSGGADSSTSSPLSGTTSTPASSSSGTSSGDGAESSDDESSDGTGAPFDMPKTCDYETRDGIVVIEAERLSFERPWALDTSVAGSTGEGALVWTGESLLQDSTRSPIELSIGFDEPGQYRFEWRTAYEGKSFTRNSTWLRFDAGYGLYARDTFGGNVRLYSRPICYDLDVLAEVASLPDVDSVQCVGGFSHQRWLDPFNRDPGNLTWSWSASVLSNFSFTEDLSIDIPEAGNYRLTIAPRLQGHFIDRIVMYADGTDPEVARDLLIEETSCSF